MDAALRRAHACAIFDAGVAAADPGHCVHQTLAVTGDELCCGPLRFPLDDISSLRLVGAGKATAAMAAAAEAILGDRIDCGAINTKYGHALTLARVETFEAGHPVPDEAGVAGARRQLELLANLNPDALVLGLFSGGGSALLPAPAEGLTLAEKQETTRLLLACGATIDEINVLRKHLSAIKGGLLARAAAPARVVALMLSDVIGDPLDTIASGPTHPDSTTFGDCLAIVDRYDLRHQLPAPVRQHLEAGTRGERPETPKPGDPCFARAESLVIGNSRLAIDAAANQASALGYEVLVLTSRLQGESRHAAAALVSIAQETAETNRPIGRPACLIAGGETTVTLRSNGKGWTQPRIGLSRIPPTRRLVRHHPALRRHRRHRRPHRCRRCSSRRPDLEPRPRPRSRRPCLSRPPRLLSLLRGVGRPRHHGSYGHQRHGSTNRPHSLKIAHPSGR